MTQLTYEAPNERATDRLGAALATALPDGAVVALHGTLGAGKTRLVRAIAEASGVAEREVVSPTFVLIKEYAGRRPIYHFDAYRLRDEDEFLELGPEEYFDAAGLTLIEWASRVAGCLPRDYLEIEIAITGPESRRFLLQSNSPRYAAVVERVGQLLGGD